MYDIGPTSAVHDEVQPPTLPLSSQIQPSEVQTTALTDESLYL